MKCKKMVSLLLAVVMILGLLPLSAMAAGTEIGTSTNGEFVDAKADPDKSYEYTVTGSDGSTQTVVVPAVGAAETGNSVTSKDIPGATYYGKVKDLSKLTGEPTLLVFQTEDFGSPVWYVANSQKKSGGLELKKAPGDRIVSDGMGPYEWTVTKNNKDQLKFTNSNGFFINTRYKESGWGAGLKVDISNNTSGNRNPWFNAKLNTSFGTSLWNKTGTHNACLNGGALGVLSVNEATSGTTFYLYQKMTESAGTQYTVNTTGLDKLITEAKTKDKALYEPATWAPFAEALKAAEAAKAALQASYNSEPDAKDALSKIDNAHNDLKKAMDALKLLPAPERFTPVIDWQRTLEMKGGATGHKLVTGLPNFSGTDYQKIVWDWNKIKNLTTDPSMTVWDYMSEAQYSNAAGVAGKVTAATWNKSYGGNWTDSSVRKFAGTFTWPEGYTLEDNAVITSVNDANYQAIYNHVNGNAELKERFGDKKVIPVNDDMYVYVYKDGENPAKWSPNEAAKHLVFWTGSSGKGKWSDMTNTGADWDRTTPPTYQDNPAVPAYHSVYPNNIDITGNTASRAGFSSGDMKLNHTDGWYTMVGTNTLMSTLNRLYPGEQLSGKMHFDIYAFDNSSTGGMDELVINFEKAPVTTAQVTVKYWLDSTAGTPLGTTTINGAQIGSTIKLSQGTANNELNHFKAAAITAAGNKEVSNGEADYGPDGYTVKVNNNVINVVYKTTGSGDVQYFTYDFGVTNQYTYTSESTPDRAELIGDATGFGKDVTVSGKTATFTYTPADATGLPARATLRLYVDNTHIETSICVIPASNVLYEENFINGSWDKTTHTAMTVSDNGDNVYGHTAAYDTSTGANGAYTATLTPDQKQTATDLKFTFSGIGLDLIGSCGPNYGTQMVIINDASTHEYVRGFMIHTDYAPGEIHQVPLLHAEKLAPGSYEVVIRGSMTPKASTVSTFSTKQSISPEAYEIFADMGLSDAEIASVEIVNAVDNIPAGSVSLMAAEPTATDSQTVSVDSFRVYRSTEKAAAAYAENEQNLIYTNVMDEAITGNFSAYVEKDAATGEFTTKTYEQAGGPENELYLKPGTGIVFGAEGAKYAQISLRAVKGATQYNHNAISHNTEMYYEVTVKNGMITIANTGSDLLAIGNLKTDKAVTTIKDKAKAVKAVAAMFAAPVEPEKPEIPAQFQINFVLTDGAVWTDGTSADQSFTLLATDGSLTAPALKAPQGMKLVGWQAVEIDKLLKDREVLTVQYLQENYDWTGKEAVITFQPVFESEAGAAFEPARFDLSARVSGLFRKQVSLTVKTSTDVASLTVNGKKINATNALLVKLGLADHYTFKAYQTVGKKETASFDVVAFDANGNASVTHTVSK